MIIILNCLKCQFCFVLICCWKTAVGFNCKWKVLRTTPDDDEFPYYELENCYQIDAQL